MVKLTYDTEGQQKTIYIPPLLYNGHMVLLIYQCTLILCIQIFSTRLTHMMEKVLNYLYTIYTHFMHISLIIVQEHPLNSVWALMRFCALLKSWEYIAWHLIALWYVNIFYSSNLFLTSYLCYQTITTYKYSCRMPLLWWTSSRWLSYSNQVAKYGSVLFNNYQ